MTKLSTTERAAGSPASQEATPGRCAPTQRLTVLQLHNRQLATGGADVVLEREAALLESHGHRVRQFFVETKQLAAMPKLQMAAAAVWNRGAVREIRQIIAAQQPDVVHVHTPYPLLSPAAFRLPVPVVHTCHSFRNSCLNGLLYRQGSLCRQCVGRSLKWPGVVGRCYKGSLAGSAVLAGSLALHRALGTFRRFVDTYITLSEFTREILIADGFPAERVVVKPNFVPSSGEPGEGNGGYALYVGRFTEEKGIDTLLRAWEGRSCQLPLKLVGDGPLRERVAAAAQRLPNIELLGWQPQEAVAQLMRDAVCLVFPSQWYEAGPLTLMEAFASGTPVVASDVGNFSEGIVHGQTGFLFRCGDPLDLQEKIVQFQADRPAQQAMRHAAFAEYQRRYSPEVNYQMLMEIYRRAISRRSARRTN